jgi:hypothetical protein
MKKTKVILCIFFASFSLFYISLDFDLLRYYLEYAFNASKWHIFNTCKVIQEKNKPENWILNKEKDWNKVLSNYVEKTRHVDYWIVTKPDVGLGLCNRMLHSASLLLFAMAINRRLWIEWEEQNYSYITYNEYAGASNYDSLFESVIHTEYRKERPLIDEKYIVANDKKCLYEKLRYSHDLNVEFQNQKILRIEGGDWFGSLLFHNPFYKNTVFRGLNLSYGFPILFKFLFSPKLANNNQKITNVNCSWLFQYRSVWPRKTASIDWFMNCAMNHGLLPSHYATTYILTDDVQQMLASARDPNTISALKKMNLPKNKTCRGKCGDQYSIQNMYALSNCQNAVLTLGSSFGTCHAHLAGAKQIFRVGYLGHCIQSSLEEGPIDANSYCRYGNIISHLSS